MTVAVDLPEAALARLEAEAARRGVSIDTVIADLADRLPAGAGTPRRRLSFAGTLAVEPDLAERAEEILDEITRRNAERS